MEYFYQDSVKCNVKLLNKDLWDSFFKLNTEMIITKPGRRMFPSMRVQVQDLDPQKDYCLLVEMVPVTKCRYRYSAATGWAPAGSEEAQSPNRFYVHPESPAPGHHWMAQAVSFGRLKLTNTANPPAGHVVMSSMHKYQPRIHIIEASDVRTINDYSPKAVVSFRETQFIAVTAYQNDRMTKMKIDHNPFAKGFRETGQSKCKRKRQRMEAERIERERLAVKKEDAEEDVDDLIVVEDLEDVVAAKRPAISPSLDSSASSDSGLSEYDYSGKNNATATTTASRSSSEVKYNPFANYPIDLYPFYYGYYHQYMMPAYPGAYVAPTHSVQDLSVKIKNKPADNHQAGAAQTKFTDFSIRAITGFA